jgi:16S rRNA (guanine527-N7)-methyltransferase
VITPAALLDRVWNHHGLPEPPRLDVPAALLAYADLLQRHGRATNLVGSDDLERILDELVCDSLQLIRTGWPPLPPPTTVVDIGSGAGLPGVPLALWWPEARVVLVEPRRRRVDFLLHVRRTLGLTHLEVQEARWEDARLPQADLWVSKAVFAPAEWLARAAPHVAPGGSVGLWGAAPEGAPVVRVDYTLSDGRRRQAGRWCSLGSTGTPP